MRTTLSAVSAAGHHPVSHSVSRSRGEDAHSGFDPVMDEVSAQQKPDRSTAAAKSKTSATQQAPDGESGQSSSTDRAAPSQDPADGRDQTPESRSQAQSKTAGTQNAESARSQPGSDSNPNSASPNSATQNNAVTAPASPTPAPVIPRFESSNLASARAAEWIAAAAANPAQVLPAQMLPAQVKLNPPSSALASTNTSISGANNSGPSGSPAFQIAFQRPGAAAAQPMLSGNAPEDTSATGSESDSGLDDGPADAPAPLGDATGALPLPAGGSESSAVSSAPVEPSGTNKGLPSAGPDSAAAPLPGSPNAADGAGFALPQFSFGSTQALHQTSLRAAPPTPARPQQLVENPAATTQTAPGAPVKSVGMVLRGSDDQIVRLQIEQTGGTVRVAVHAGDSPLADHLRAGLPDLVDRLDRQGYAPQVNLPPAAGSSSAGNWPPSQQQHEAAFSGQPGERQQHSQRGWEQLASQLHES